MLGVIVEPLDMKEVIVEAIVGVIVAGPPLPKSPTPPPLIVPVCVLGPGVLEFDRVPCVLEPLRLLFVLLLFMVLLGLPLLRLLPFGLLLPIGRDTTEGGGGGANTEDKTRAALDPSG